MPRTKTINRSRSVLTDPGAERKNFFKLKPRVAVLTAHQHPNREVLNTDYFTNRESSDTMSIYNTLLSVQFFSLRDYRTEYIYNKRIDFLYLLYYFVVLDCSNITQEMKYKHNGNLHTDNKLSVDNPPQIDAGWSISINLLFRKQCR